MLACCLTPSSSSCAIYITFRIAFVPSLSYVSPFYENRCFPELERLWGGISRHGSVGLFPKRKLSTAKRKQLSRFDALWRQTRGVAQSLRRRKLPRHASDYTPVRRCRSLTPLGGKLAAWLNRCGVEPDACHATPIIPQSRLSCRSLTPLGGKLAAWLNRCGTQNACQATPIIPQCDAPVGV